MGEVSGSNGANHDPGSENRSQSHSERFSERRSEEQFEGRSTPPESWRDPALPVSPTSSPDGQADRVAIFLDGSNLFYAASQLQIEIDYVRLLNFLVQDRRLLRAYFYTGTDQSSDRQQGFLLWMRRNGYRVVTKDLVPLADGSKTANLDVEIVIDMMTLSSHCDTLILLSGNGNLAYAVNALSYRGAQVELVSLRSMTSESLINVADRYIDLAAIQQEICR
jgi:uncharacterized LabA/DUF88 family protein